MVRYLVVVLASPSVVCLLMVFAAAAGPVPGCDAKRLDSGRGIPNAGGGKTEYILTAVAN